LCLLGFNCGNKKITLIAGSPSSENSLRLLAGITKKLKLLPNGSKERRPLGPYRGPGETTQTPLWAKDLDHCSPSAVVGQIVVFE